jgi:uncharacterized coiled-coil DUF342 family protein
VTGIIGPMPVNKEKIAALIEESRELQKQANRLEEKFAELQKQVEEQRCAFDDAAFSQK